MQRLSMMIEQHLELAALDELDEVEALQQ